MDKNLKINGNVSEKGFVQNIFVIGASGKVGRELILEIMGKDGPSHNTNPSNIVGISNSNHFLFTPSGIDENILSDIVKSRESALQVLEQKGKKFDTLDEFLEVVGANKMDGGVIFADVTAGKEELRDLHVKILQDTQNSLVTANKNPISLYSMEDFKKLDSYYGRYDTNTTVMGGGGILNFVDSRNSINDEILSIKGVFSGTLGYILSELGEGQETFSQIVKRAKNKGYTEPNPMDDLNGLDVARKLVILARYAGHNVNINDVQIEPLIDTKYGAYTGDDFFAAIQAEDEGFKNRVEEARNKGEVLRYTGEMKFINGVLELNVGLVSVPKSSDLGTLKGTLNIAVVETQILKDEGATHVIKSPGAGLKITASSVRSGIAKMLPHGLSKR